MHLTLSRSAAAAALATPAVSRLEPIGSTARGRAGPASGVDLIATFRDSPAPHDLRDMVKLSILERLAAHTLRRSVDTLTIDWLDDGARRRAARHAIRVC